MSLHKLASSDVTKDDYICCCVCLFVINGGFLMVASVFLLAVPDHRCALPGWVNDMYAVQNSHHKYLINQTIPPPEDDTLDYEPCHYYKDRLDLGTRNGTTDPAKQTCTEWVYDESVFKSTFATKAAVFLLAVPDHRCALPGWVNDTYEVQNPHHAYLINQTIPPPEDDTLDYDPCHYYKDRLELGSSNVTIDPAKQTCNTWVYDESVFKSTFATKIDLVCNDKFLPSVAKMIFFGGVLVGALLFGILADVIGRKRVYLLSLVIVMASSIAISWAHSYSMFVVLWSVIGAGNAGIFMTGFVISMEMVGPSKRMWAGIVIEYFFATGLLVLTGIGYLIRDWNYFAMAIAFPNLIYIVYFWLIPESPRWLLSQGRIEEAEAILRHAANVNGVELPEKIFDKEAGQSDGQKGNIFDLFKSKIMAVRTLIIFFNWMVVSMVYYGLSLNTGNLGGSLYVNFLISGLVEFPAYTLCLLLLDRVGRKWLHAASMVIGGLCCISTVFTTVFGGDDLQTLTITLAMLGKLGVSAAFAVIYVYSAELYPTIVRNAGMGASSCCARIGGMAAPYIADLDKVVSGEFGHALPLVIFGGFSVAAGILSLMLPETLNRQLPESIEDAEDFAKSPYKKDIAEAHVNDGFKMEGSKEAENGQL